MNNIIVAEQSRAEINTIAVTQSPFNSVFERNIIENNGKIILRALE